MRQVLDSGVVRIRSELRRQPESRPTCWRSSDAPYQGLGLLPQARSALDSAIALRRRAGDEGGALAEDEAVLANVLADAGAERRRRLLADVRSRRCASVAGRWLGMTPALGG